MKKEASIKAKTGLLILALLLSITACGGAGNVSSASNVAEAPSSSSAPAGSEASQPVEQVTLTVWLPKTFSTEADEMIQARLEDYVAQSDQVKELKVEYLAATDGYAKWNAAIESGVIPDMTFLHCSAYITYTDMDVLLDITDVINEIESSYSPMLKNHKDGITINGRICSLPLYAQMSMLTYRTDLLEAAGYSEPPKTLDELREIAKAVSDPTQGIYGLGIGMAVADDGEDTLMTIMRGFGSRFWDEEGNCVVNSPETVEAIKFLTSMYTDDKSIPPSVVEWDASGNNKSYLAGESAMVFNPPTLYNSTKAEDLADILGQVTSMAPCPGGTAEHWTNQNYIMFSAFKNTPYPELSKEMLRYLIDPVWYDSYIEKNFPVAGPVFEKTTEGELWKSEMGQRLIQQSRYGGAYAHPCKDVKVMAAEAKAYNDFTVSKTLQKVIINHMSAEDAAAELEKDLLACLASVQ